LKGYVDESLRALLEVKIRAEPSGNGVSVTTWVDSAFNGHLVFSKILIEQLSLRQEAATHAVLADGNTTLLESYLCYVEWFGKLVPAQVIANDGQFPLLGTGLLEDRVLHIDYAAKQLSLD